MIKISLRVVALLIGALLLAGCGARPDDNGRAATLVIEAVGDARIWTGDPDNPWAEAVAIAGDSILAVGSCEAVDAYSDDKTSGTTITRGLIVPGFIDTHVHFVDGGEALASVQLRDAQSPDEFAKRIADFAAELEPGEWIFGGAWDHENWGGELPRRDWIDAVTPDNPVWIYRLDGHMALANSLAMSLAGVDADTADVAGGEIARYEDGRPAGVFKDNAMRLFSDAIPERDAALLAKQIKAAMRYVASNGVTTVHDMGQFEHLEAYRRLHAEDALNTRIYSVVPLSEWQRLEQDVRKNGRGDDWLRTGGLKGFMDGSLGSHTAAFFDAFTDTPDERGFLINELDDMRAWISSADEAGLHVNVHAIGDRAIADLLDIYLDVAEDHGPRDRRFRVEHAQHIRPADIHRFAAQDVIASMQPYHAIDDGRWAEKVIGEQRAQTTYAFRSLIDSGARVAFGSDWFVAPATPIEGIYAAVTRRTLDGQNPDGWVPEQKITVEQALRAYTVEGAYASFDEDRKGMLKAGMLADIVVLSEDLFALPPEELANVQVWATYVGGEAVYEAWSRDHDPRVGEMPCE
ncbi:MAG: amidohydrolase [Pseudomonadota bacterium]